MLPFYRTKYGNPSSIHSFGEEAKEGMVQARERIATAIGAVPEEVFFTSGGTESNNIALQGFAFANREKGKHIITSAVEHHAILHTCQFLGKQGFEISYLPVDREGAVDPEMVRSELRDDTVLISIMTANNEIGTVQPFREIALLAHVVTPAVRAGGAPITCRCPAPRRCGSCWTGRGLRPDPTRAVRLRRSAVSYSTCRPRSSRSGWAWSTAAWLGPAAGTGPRSSSGTSPGPERLRSRGCSRR